MAKKTVQLTENRDNFSYSIHIYVYIYNIVYRSWYISHIQSGLGYESRLAMEIAYVVLCDAT